MRRVFIWYEENLLLRCPRTLLGFVARTYMIMFPIYMRGGLIVRLALDIMNVKDQVFVAERYNSLFK